VGSFVPAGNTANATFFLDWTGSTGVSAYWYRVVATDGAGHPSTGPPAVPNPDDPDHWACADLTGCPPPPAPLAIGPIQSTGGGSLQAPILSNLSTYAGTRMYRGIFLPAAGSNLHPSSQNHAVIHGAQGNCFAPPTSAAIGDSDPQVGRWGTGSFYYLVVPLRENVPGETYAEGPIDTEGFPGNAQVMPRLPPGNHNCPR
jgi:hypothetical protein